MSIRMIYKYVLTGWVSDIEMPKSAGILSVGTQEGSIVVWAMVDPDAPTVTHRVSAVNTGERIPEGDPAFDGAFVGTVTMVDPIARGMVWHIFDCGEVA